ncbi:MAG: FAD-dependent oxidoreductase [Opitutaceae bacterium]|nr:FAD-dependent oxidoreductase [Opitutaceae bacterium]
MTEQIRSRLSLLNSKVANATPDSGLPVIDLSTDVLVAGGGMSGVCAALAAARNGARVVLVQNRSRLGGNASSEVRMHIVGANWHKNRPGWREGGILEELRLDDAVNNPRRCREMWDLLLYDKVMTEPNITLLLDSTLVSAGLKEDRIEEVTVRCDTTERIYRIRANLFCDCTGDSRLALEAGAEMRHGRESRAEFGESLAPENADRETLGSSILFTSRKHDEPVPFAPPSWARKMDEAQLRRRTIKSWEYGYWWIEWGGHIDTVSDNERIRFELLAIVMGIWDHIKNSGRFPESANWALEWIGMVPGKRESRRIMGDHILTQQDLIDGGNFEDAVAIGGWPMDDHPPGGFDSTTDSPGRQVATKEVFNIPLRALYSRNVGNLFMAGRNISASHVAFTSTRVMGTCSVMGQAIGTAAALCIRHGMLPRKLYQQKPLLQELQQLLIADDQTIKGVRHESENDIARQATISASAEEGEALAANVTNGWLRDFPGPSVKCLPELDVPLEMCGAGEAIDAAVNHWAGRLDVEGAWIELRWEKPRTIRSIQLAFDTGFQRELTLTSSDSINNGIIRGPQPETVRDYNILGCRSGEQDWHLLASVTGNYQRLRRHPLPAGDVQAVRIHVFATHGDPCAKIFEIRCLV